MKCLIDTDGTLQIKWESQEEKKQCQAWIQENFHPELYPFPRLEISKYKS